MIVSPLSKLFFLHYYIHKVNMLTILLEEVSTGTMCSHQLVHQRSMSYHITTHHTPNTHSHITHHIITSSLITQYMYTTALALTVLQIM